MLILMIVSTNKIHVFF